jgi:hypothetical protein
MNQFHYPNAFTINLLGNSAFPFSAAFSQKENLHNLYIFPLQIESITDLIEKYVERYLVVFNVDHYWETKAGKWQSLVEVAQEQKLNFDIFDDETICFEKYELAKLLKDFSHYNFAFFDFEEKPDIDLVLENYIIFDDQNWKEDSFLLNKVKKTSFFLSSHDDCYLNLETYNLNFLHDVFERNLQFYVSTYLLENEQKGVSDSKLEMQTLSEILSENKEVTICLKNTFAKENTLVIPFSNKKYDFYEQTEEINGKILFDFENNEWKVER